MTYDQIVARIAELQRTRARHESAKIIRRIDETIEYWKGELQNAIDNQCEIPL